MRTLVTGGSGFIGTHLVRRLLEEGDDVVVLDSLEQQVHGEAPPATADGAELIWGTVGNPEVVDRALRDVDRIVHLAAVVGVGQSMYEIARYVSSNTLATAVLLERVVERAEQIQRLVVASSMSIYGEGEYDCSEHGRIAVPPRNEEQLLAREWECLCPRCERSLQPVGTPETKPLIPTSVYAITKRDHEELCLVTGAAYDVPTVALRFFNVYGPGQALSNPYTGVAAIFASRLLNGNPPVIFEDGRQSRDFIHVDDIVEGIALALRSDEAVGRSLNLGTGLPATVNDVAEALSSALDAPFEPSFANQYRAGDIRHCFADTAAASEFLGFEAGVLFEDGMADLARWLADQEAVDRVDQAAQELLARGLAR